MNVNKAVSTPCPIIVEPIVPVHKYFPDVNNFNFAKTIAYVEKIEKNIKKTYNKRFLFNHTPTEMSIFRNVMAIIIRRDEPIIILIKDKETADSFRKYFEELWNIAKR